MITKEELTETLWFDIETTPIVSSFEQLEKDYPKKADIWKRRFHHQYVKNGESLTFANTFEKNAAPIPEFSKCIAVSFGRCNNTKIAEPDDSETYLVKGIYADNEKDILMSIHKIFNNPTVIIGGYNIIGFDIPYLAKHYIKHGINIPVSLQTRNHKPWDLKHLDLMNIWKGTAFSNTNLEALEDFLEVSDSKTEFDGSQIYELYRTGKITLAEISKYCNRDVISTMQVAQRLCYDNLTSI